MIRHNFLTDAEAAQKYIEGVRRLKDPEQFPWEGQDGLSIYDSFVFWHHQSMMLMTPPNQNDRNAAHSGPAFLPWHRYFLITLEGLLRQALNDNEFRIPYWDWTTDAELSEPATSPIWSNANLGQFALLRLAGSFGDEPEDRRFEASEPVIAARARQCRKTSHPNRGKNDHTRSGSL